MANIKVSQLPTATEFNDDDYVMIVQSNQNKKITKQNMYSDYVYSMSETIVGKWTNNKPIYRKVIETTTSAGSTNIPISDISSDIEEIIKLDGTTTQPSGNVTPLSYYYSSNDWSNLYYSANSNYIIIRCGSTAGFGDAKLIVEYTKTTD